MFRNLCHFAIVLAGTRIEPEYPAQLVFRPIVEKGSHPEHPILIGFRNPEENFEGLLGLMDPGADIIVPRFAAAVGWARDFRVNPYCVPLSGVRNPADNSYATDALEAAPDGLELGFLEEPLDAQEMSPKPKYVRLVGGTFTIEVEGGPDLPAEPKALTTYRNPDDSVFVPELDVADNDDEVALIVPQDGKIIKAIAEAYPAAALLVTDVVRPGHRTRLFQVR